tara:strand:+ start:1486 stop:2208 length:723 start_codon:yes stop_codon:yes gene_type:complete
MIKIGWTPTTPEIALIYQEPESVYKNLYTNIDSSFKLCPAFTDFLKNWYILKSPLDINFLYKKVSDTDAKITYNEIISPPYISFNERKRDWSPEHRPDERLKLEKNNNPLISFSFHQLFVTDEKDLHIEQVSPFLHMHELSYFKYLRTIPGAFNIHSWIRPLDFAYEIITDNAIIDIKKGDPLCYVRFNTHKKVKIEQIPFTSELDDYSIATTSFKEVSPGLSLAKMYNLFRRIRRPKLL